MLLTSRGRALLALSIALLVVGRVLALNELIMAGVAFGLPLAVGTVAVWLRRASVDVRRRVEPARTHVGQDVRVDLTVRSESTLGSGPILAVDHLPEALGAPVRLTLDASRTGRTERSVAYLVGPQMRGRYPLGPLELRFTDPFGTVQRTTQVPGTANLIVYPSYETINTLPMGSHRLGVVRHSPLLGQGDEFYALRNYEEGDDLRKVHWPSSAKLGRMVIRQEELLAEPRVLLLLDTCTSKHRGAGRRSSLEAAISACASVGVLAVKRRMRLDVLTADGSLVSTRLPRNEELLEALALVEPSDRTDLVNALRNVDPRRQGRAAVVVVITPGLAPAELGALARTVGSAGAGAFVHVDAATYEKRTSRARTQRPDSTLGLPVVHLHAGVLFRQAWETGVRDVAVAR